MFGNLVNENLINALKIQNITSPTQVQKDCIPIIKTGNDLIVMSKTGTGKTLAYLLPIFGNIDLNIKQPQVIIIAPTHELASQVHREAQLLSDALCNGITSTLIIGGANIKRQLDNLKQKPRIIVGSTGRILEIMKMKKLTGHYVKTIVVDEADRMLDSFNLEGVNGIVKTTLKDRQLIFVSATMDDKTISVVKDMSKDNLEIVKYEEQEKLPINIEHMYFECEARDKVTLIRKLISAENVNKALIFTNNQDELEKMVDKLEYHNIKTAGLYGTALKRERKQALIDLREGRKRVLVTNDIASRGLDIKGVGYIFNLDVPENPTFYVHRAGRTGRMTSKGVSIIIATKYELDKIKNLEKKLNITIKPKVITKGKIFDINL